MTIDNFINKYKLNLHNSKEKYAWKYCYRVYIKTQPTYYLKTVQVRVSISNYRKITLTFTGNEFLYE